jgi:O-antigen/teichoic acid export membrane protein
VNYFFNIIHIVRSKQLSRTFSVYTIGKGVSFLLAIFLLPLFTKKLPVYDFGVIGLLWLITPLLSRVMNLGMDVGVSLKFFKEDHQVLSRTLYNGLFAIVCVASFIWLFGFLQINWLQSIIDKSISQDIYTLLVVSCLFSCFTTLMRSFLQNAGRATINVLMTILPQLLIVVITYYLVLNVSATYKSYVWGLALGNLVCGSLALCFFVKNYSVRHFRFSLSILKNLLRIGLPVLPGTIGGLILASGDRYIIKYFLGMEAVAIYTFGYRFASQISEGLFQPFQKAFSPVIYKRASKDNKQARAYSIRIINNMLLFFSIVLAIAVIPMKDIINIMGSHEYAGAYAVFVVSSLGTFIYAASQADTPLLNFIERTELTAGTVILCATLNVALNYIFVPKYGILAAAVTTIISYLVLLISRNYFMLYFFKQNNLLQILLRIFPLAIYLPVVLFFDFIIKDTAHLYAAKLFLFICFLFLQWTFYPDLKPFMKSILLKRENNF